jgi:uncharacterized protein YjbI with pentapeptide repeats
MTNYKIHETNSGRTLFEGHFTSFKNCLETAVKDRINLSGADFTNKNLSNANIDDAIMPDANFTNTNLSGANISESNIKNATFTNTTLYNTCLC